MYVQLPLFTRKSLQNRDQVFNLTGTSRPFVSPFVQSLRGFLVHVCSMHRGIPKLLAWGCTKPGVGEVSVQVLLAVRTRRLGPILPSLGWWAAIRSCSSCNCDGEGGTPNFPLIHPHQYDSLKPLGCADAFVAQRGLHVHVVTVSFL